MGATSYDARWAEEQKNKRKAAAAKKEAEEAEIRKLEESKKIKVSPKKKKKKAHVASAIYDTKDEPDKLDLEIKATLSLFNRKKKILIYCKLDKSPETVESSPGIRPNKPMFEGDSEWMYGRGCANAGWGVFAALLAIKNMQK